MANWLEACSRTRVSTIALTVPFGSWNWMVTCRWNASGWRYSVTSLRAPAGISTKRCTEPDSEVAASVPWVGSPSLTSVTAMPIQPPTA